MASALSHISIEELKSLNGFALSASPGSQDNLSRAITALAAANGSQTLCCDEGYLVVGGQALARAANRQELEAMLEAVLEAPVHARHPAEQVVACVSLLRHGPGHHATPSRFSLGELQQRLSALLIEHPVLMDHRLVYSFAAPDPEWSTLPVAIAETSFASLPSLADGFSPKQLQCFACNASVASGIDQPNGTFLQPPTSRALTRKTAFQVATNGEGTATPPPTPGATRGGFLASLLHLNDLSRTFTGTPLLDPVQQGFSPANFYKAMANVVWDLALEDGANTAASVAQVRSALALRSLVALDGQKSGTHRDVEIDLTVATSHMGMSTVHPSMLSLHMASRVDAALFAPPRPGLPGDPMQSAEDLLRHRSKRFMETLVALGIEPDLQAAGIWLANATVGDRRMNRPLAAPRASSEAVCGFLWALHEVGVTVPPLEAPSASDSSARWSTYQAWTATCEAFTTARCMEDVYAAHQALSAVQHARDGDVTTPPAPSQHARAHRRTV